MKGYSPWWTCLDISRSIEESKVNDLTGGEELLNFCYPGSRVKYSPQTKYLLMVGILLLCLTEKLLLLTITPSMVN